MGSPWCTAGGNPRHSRAQMEMKERSWHRGQREMELDREAEKGHR